MRRVEILVALVVVALVLFTVGMVFVNVLSHVLSAPASPQFDLTARTLLASD